MVSENCKIEEMGQELKKEVEGYSLPANFDGLFGDMKTIAQIRHEYTNYDELLDNLSRACYEFQKEHGHCAPGDKIMMSHAGATPVGDA